MLHARRRHGFLTRNISTIHLPRHAWFEASYCDLYHSCLGVFFSLPLTQMVPYSAHQSEGHVPNLMCIFMPPAHGSTPTGWHHTYLCINFRCWRPAKRPLHRSVHQSRPWASRCPQTGWIHFQRGGSERSEPFDSDCWKAFFVGPASAWKCYVFRGGFYLHPTPRAHALRF